MSKADLPILTFPTREAWEAWLAVQPRSSDGVWLRLSKKGAPEPTLSKADAIEAALCHGWIDGQLDKLDQHYWLTRFTPRKPQSKWSEINRTKALELIAQGRMRPAGAAEIAAAKADGRWEGAYQSQATAVVPADLRAALDAEPAAAAFFETLDRHNRYAVLHRVHDAKKAETRAARIAKFVDMLARGATIYPVKTKANPGTD